MNRNRAALVLAVAAMAGGLAPFGVPSAWLGDVLLGGLLVTLVFGSLAAMSAREPEDQASTPLQRIAAWLVVGTERPMARVSDPLALLLFFAGVAFLAGLAVGTFVAPPG
ncbi:MAG: hypothetical protein EKK52_02950 [Burkholderiales bacterium]|uniref:hypothetical protein n=1 Tax=Roseateles sp. TaxID=1971397 RepID=UPI000F964FD1|nr:MAG: hypothetical protein EKK52_02950 [Burkholderiales bacterium]